MAMVAFTGCEARDLSEVATATGTISAQNSIARNNGWAFRTNPTTTGTGAFTIVGRSAAGTGVTYNVATAYYRFYFRYETKPASNEEYMVRFQDTGGADKVTLRLQSDGAIDAYNAAGSSLATGSTLLAASTWYLIEVKLGSGASAPYELKINGTVEYTGTSSGIGNNNGGARFGKPANLNGNSVDYYFDDIALDDAAYLGAGSCVLLLPTGPGSTTTWSGDYTSVDDFPHDGDTTTIVGTNTGEVELVAVTDTSTAGITGTINCVLPYAMIKFNGGGDISLSLRLRSGGTNSDTTAGAAITAYVSRAKLHSTDPNTGAAWTLSALDSVEAGVVCGNNQDHVATSIGVFVDFVPAAVGGGGVPTGTLSMIGVGK